MVRNGFRKYGTKAPLPASWVAQYVFLTPRRFPRPEKERCWLEGGARASILLDGLPIALWQWEGTGPTIGIVHGWEGRGSQLGAFIAPLVEAGFSVVAWDAPGHGNSGGKNSGIIKFASAARAVADHVGGLHGVVAHSMGAAATCLAVTRGLQLETAVFVAPAPSVREAPYRFARHLHVPRDVMGRMVRRLESRNDMSFAELQRHVFDGAEKLALLVYHDKRDPDVPLLDGEMLEALGAEFRATEGLGHRRILRHAGVIEGTVAYLESSRP